MTFKKHRHRAQGFRIRRVRKPLEMIYTFTPSCRYNLGSDQWDWNKLHGVKDRYFHPRQNSDMYCWRYNPGHDIIEMGIYSHDQNGLARHPLDIQKVKIGHPVLAKGITRKGWRINGWFGGNNPAPHDIEIEIKFL